MKMLLATAADQPWSRELRQAVEQVALADRFGVHSLASDPEEADVILLLDVHQQPGDWRQRAVRGHPIVRRFPRKVFVYDERDQPRDSLPGLYVAMPRSTYDQRRHRAFGYYLLVNDTRSVTGHAPDLLFSFQGRSVDGVRREVLRISHPRAVVEDTSRYDFFTFSPSKHAALAGVAQRYREVMGRSKFVLCPRGAGTASLRLFETLACGRVPVILSDEWVPPEGIDWDSCSVRVPECRASAVAEVLEALEPDWPAMSRAARAVYDDWFARDVWFHRATEYCLELLDADTLGPRRQWASGGFWHAGLRQWKGDARRLAGSGRNAVPSARRRWSRR